MGHLTAAHMGAHPLSQAHQPPPPTYPPSLVHTMDLNLMHALSSSGAQGYMVPANRAAPSHPTLAYSPQAQ
eukprot:scaffold49850_cov20-Tisochrysis_lutea.AAC.1